jgi:glycosyltransferase involved in cell wall biosynthesis
MKLAYLCHEYPPAPHGGIGTSVRTLARGMADRGHDVTVVGAYPQPMATEERDGNVRVVRLAASRVPKVGWWIDRLRVRTLLRKLAASGEIELVEAPEWQGVAWPAAGYVPTVLRFNGSSVTFGRLLGRKVPRSLRWLEQQGFTVAAGCVAVSRFIARETAADFGLAEERIPVIPNAIDASVFSPPANVARDDRLVVYIGTVTEKKGVVELIRAWSRVVDRCPDARLAVVGQDGRHTATGRSLIAVLGEMLPASAATSVTFAGAVPHAGVQEWLRRAAVAVYPTFVEALPLTWLEAMATRTPIIGSCLGPGEELVEQGRTGLLCDPRDTEELARQVVTCLHDPDLRSRMGAAGRRQVEERFSTEVVLPQNEAFYGRYLRGGIPVHGVPRAPAASGAGSS